MTPSNTETAAFCGEHGAFAELALFRVFGNGAANLPVSTFAAVFDAVLDSSAAFGVVPVENSLAGSVHENYDLFIRYPDIAIVGEIKLRIVHNLIVHPEADWDTIKTVRSHPQGLAQCKAFLDQHPRWQLEAWNNTAAAVVSIVKEEKTPRAIAAIASDAAARLNGLKILAAGIETNPANYTRFVIISRGQGEDAPRPACSNGTEKNKASLVFAIKDKPGSLYECLKILAEHNINLSKIESRPIHGQPWHYMFYLDVTIPPDREVFETAIRNLKKMTEDFHFLGSYSAAL